ncbi:hypothetical protein GV054_21180 [Marinomonas mediterranea]|uniref:phage late control D family protein n=1 Tax=Marinomonas mediterranea TaxID=119864 RepID=UPI00234AB008|nr:hypothetical protein [Marinomonas mediterranea]WCN15341.1 hypothetical protein GV054_21180 [Marinomonas mediterranea]
MVITPTYRLFVNDKDVTDRVSPYLVSLRVTDNEKDNSDELSLVFSAKFKRPEYGDQIKVFLGGKDQQNYVGAFYVQKTSIRNNCELSVNATGMDFGSNIKERRHHRYEQITLAELAVDIATRHGLGYKSDLTEELHDIEQVNESDINLLNRIAKDHSVIFNIKNSILYLMKQEEAPPEVMLDIDRCIDSQISHSNTTFYRRCSVKYQDTKRNKMVTVSVGKGEPTLVKQGHFTSEDEAKLEAINALKRANQGTAQGNASVPGKIMYAGSRLILGDEKYTITRVEQSISNSGWVTSLDFKSNNQTAL